MANPFADPNYKVPKKPGNYMQLEDGQNLLRMLANPIDGYEYWTEDADGRHPNRVEDFDEVPEEYQNVPDDTRKEAKYFWAFPVWNYKMNRVQLLELTQKGLIESILNLQRDEGWGSPLDYDLIITKSGKEMQTRYTILPRPKKELDPAIQNKWNNTHINLEAMYSGADPFAPAEPAPVASSEVAQGHQIKLIEDTLKKLKRSKAEYEKTIGKAIKSLTRQEAEAYIQQLAQELKENTATANVVPEKAPF